METSTARSPYQELEGRSVAPPAGEAPFELGWHHEAKFRSRPNGRDGSVLFFSGMEIFPNQAGSVEKRRR